MAGLTEYAWPGNVRELENAIRRFVLLDREHALEGLVDLSRGTPGPVARPSDPESLREVARRGAREAELKALQDVLEGVGWNRAEAARILKVSYKTMLNKVAQYSLTPSRCV